MFGDDRRRQINLGGASSTASHASVLARAQQDRLKRQKEKQERDASRVIQRRWRAYTAAKYTRIQWLQSFDREPTGSIPSTRYLVFAGGEHTRLVAWTNAALDSGEDAIFSPFNGSERNSWIVLLRQLVAIMLTQIVQAPSSEDSALFLRFITILVTPRRAHPDIAPIVLQYLLSRNLHVKLSEAFRKIPPESKSKAPTLPGLVRLSVLPFKAFPAPSPFYTRALSDIILHILTIPFFANRIPIASLSQFSANVPFGAFDLVDPLNIVQSVPDAVSHLHLLANLLTFVPPRYTSTDAMSLTGKSLAVYIEILNNILCRLPSGSLESPPKPKQVQTMEWTPQEDSDDDEVPASLRVASVTESRATVFPSDNRTAAKLSMLVSSAHILSLLTASNKYDPCWSPFLQLIINITIKWPSKREQVLSPITVSNAGNVFKRLWRESVRRTPLGRNENASFLKDPRYKDEWPPLLLLTDLYTQALLTMGDDEFFSTTAKSGNVVVSRNPFTIGEVIELSRKLLNIVFPLYWNETQEGNAGQIFGLPITWELLRERITKCLQAIHARDSRRPFTPARHWLVTDQLDLDSFVEAAIAEEESLKGNHREKQLTKRKLAYLSPRQGVLNNIPFALPFDARVNILRSYIRNDRAKNVDLVMHTDVYRKKITVRRDHISQDGFDHLNDLGAAWKGRLAITFVDQWGQEEAGIDGGGVFKEFLTSLSREVFDTNRGLWLATSQQELYPNPHSYAREPHQLNWYRFIGRVLGKALYEDILVDVSFARFFLAKWLKKQSFLDDLASLDPQLYQGLVYLKNYAGDPQELSLDFSITEDDLGVTRTIDLIPNGSNTPVTRENRLLYIQLVAYYRLTVQIKKQSDAFFEGLSDIIEPRWLRMFNQQELKILVGGAEEPIDLDDLRKHVVYGGLYDENHPTVNMFWRVVKNFDQDKRKLLLRFVTSCARPPLLGFSELRPKFAIRDAGIDDSRLPTASTCVNLLKLPLYQDEDTLRRKLLHAISSGAGFDLS